jgi:hypothetical protein
MWSHRGVVIVKVSVAVWVFMLTRPKHGNAVVIGLKFSFDHDR